MPIFVYASRLSILLSHNKYVPLKTSPVHINNISCYTDTCILKIKTLALSHTLSQTVIL